MTADIDKTIQSVQEWIEDVYADNYPIELMQDSLDLLKEYKKILEEIEKTGGVVYKR